MASSNIILTNQTEMSYVGDKAKGDGFYGFSDGLHTVSFHVNAFTGRLFLEATLVDDPTENDWFYITLEIDQNYIQFDNETTARGVTFTGNFVYIRASVDRSYLVDQTYDPTLHGVLNKVVLMI